MNWDQALYMAGFMLAGAVWLAVCDTIADWWRTL